MPTKAAPSHWTLRAAALLCMLDDWASIKKILFKHNSILINIIIFLFILFII
jgi:hypothetical protein